MIYFEESYSKAKIPFKKIYNANNYWFKDLPNRLIPKFK